MTPNGAAARCCCVTPTATVCASPPILAMTTDACARLRAIGGLLMDRLPEGRVAIALDLLDRNEIPMALDQLCSDIDECGMALSRAEYLQLRDLNTALGQPVAPATMRRLRKLDGGSA
ncbi:MafI family immunity protein [Stenotrophomonas maltophilia]|uniref:MafI family immunity protein n=2 Tax=Stenotrophomonas maltophilia TaxID=40324 RepID=UPI0031B73D0A